MSSTMRTMDRFDYQQSPALIPSVLCVLPILKSLSQVASGEIPTFVTSQDIPSPISFEEARRQIFKQIFQTFLLIRRTPDMQPLLLPSSPSNLRISSPTRRWRSSLFILLNPLQGDDGGDHDGEPARLHLRLPRSFCRGLRHGERWL